MLGLQKNHINIFNAEFVKLTKIYDTHNSVIDRILVLFQPSSNIVRNCSSIVDNSKVSILISLRLRLCHGWCLAQVLCLQLLFKGLVSRLGKERFLLHKT